MATGGKTGKAAGLVMAMFMVVATSASTQLPATPAERPQRRVLVSLTDRKLALLEGSEVLRVYEVAVGAEATPSPAGVYEVVTRLTEPTWYYPGKVIGPGPENPLGTRWIGLDRRGYGIHGTNAPETIGKAASRGCIRMRNEDVEELFEMVAAGDVVEIREEPETAARSGEEAAVVASPARQ